MEARHRAVAAEIQSAGRNHGESIATGVMRLLRFLWKDAADRDPALPTNAVSRLKRQWYGELRRERVLRMEKIPRLYQYCRLLNPVARHYMRLLLSAGLRRP